LTVNIYLLLIDDEQYFFYSEDSEVQLSKGEGSTAQASAAAGWLERRWQKLQTAWYSADAGLALWARRIWDWLHSRAHPDESMLVRFRLAHRIDLYHPASRPGDAIAGVWRDYLVQRSRRHLFWLCGNAAIAPLALLLLWPLPGPNLIGYWFAYRAIHHLLIVRGIRRVRKGLIPTLVHGLDSLDLPIHRGQDGKASHPALNGAGGRLDDYLSWSKPSSPVAPEQQQPMPSASPGPNDLAGPG
jgi:hypothetical protein